MTYNSILLIFFYLKKYFTSKVIDTWKQYNTAHRRVKGCLSLIIDINKTTIAGL